MIGQKLEEKNERGDTQPFFMTTLSKFNQETSSHVLDMDHVWVSNIYKKDLVKLGATVLSSKLGGQIGNTCTTDWYFKITREEYESISKKWKQDRAKDFREKLASGHYTKKRAWDDLKKEFTNKKLVLYSKKRIADLVDEMDESEDLITFMKAVSEYKCHNIYAPDVLEMMEKLE